MNRKKMSRISLLGQGWKMTFDKVMEHIWINTVGHHEHMEIRMGKIIQSASLPREPTKFLLEFQMIPQIDGKLMNIENDDIMGEIFRTIFRGIEHIATDVDLIVKQYQKKLEYKNFIERTKK